ncbi:MAG: alpha-galactosidase, partial [Verrucomicrobia bacterium]|nr:alpha-galactosidase [Verrucomicrobiota bacterium]
MKKFCFAMLAAMAGFNLSAAQGDWLIDPAPYRAVLSTNANSLVLENGLVRRVFRLQPNAATIAYDNLMTGESIIRSVRPEARVELGGVKYDVGGLVGQPVHNYLDAAWLDKLQAEPGAFRFTSFKAGKTEARFPWKKRSEWMPQDMPWPPAGVSLTLEFAAPEAATSKGVTVEVHYELYDGIPLMSKWLVVRNAMDQSVRLNSFICELLAAVEPESIVDDSPTWQLPNLMVETDYTFGGMSGPNHSAGVHWVADPLYSSQVNYNRQTPCLLECRPPLGPDQVIAPGGSFESFRAFELAQDSTDRERKTLALRRMYRTVAPWVTENPVLMHVRSARPDAVRLAIDQCAEVGF